MLSLSCASASTLALTARQSLGPFYPADPPAKRDNDLTRVAGQAEAAKGISAAVRGRLLDANGQPISGARIEIWQCDTNGVYRHPRDRRSGRADPGFQGFGHDYTDAEGGYQFVTIRPAPYSGRTPHIHYAVFDGDERILVTQLYVEGEPRNSGDFLYSRLSSEERKTVTVPFQKSAQGGATELAARFDIIIAAGAGGTAASS
jgi:protocatechuate 3,4-dioxygenase beta subunit